MEDPRIEEQRILKQTYLREEILDVGYDPYSFQIHMESLREDGANIDKWTLGDLQRAVIEYKKKAEVNQNKLEFERIPAEEVSIQSHMDKPNPDLSAQIEQGIEELNVQSPKNYKQEEEKEESKIYTKEMAKNEEFSMEIQTRKQREYTEGPLPTEIQIIRTEIEKGGLFGLGRSHINYVVRSEPCNWEVKRRFSDFTWLRQTLVKLYPGFLVPTMTKKKAGKGKVEYYTMKKKAYLTTFLTNLTKTPEFINNEYTINFLKTTDKKKFDSKKKEADMLKGAARVEEHMNIEGKVDLKINEEHKLFSHYISEYIAASSSTYSNMKKKTKKLLLDLDQVSTSVFDLGANFNELFNLSIDAASKLLDTSKLECLKDVYVSMNTMMVSWGNTLVKQANFLQENFLYFLKYQSKQVLSFQELLKTRQSTEQEYTRFKLRLEAKKEKLWLVNDPSKWELSTNLKIKPIELQQNKIEAFKQMCAKENNIENEMKKLTGYFNSQVMKEVTKGLELKAYGYRKMIDGLTKDTQQNFEEMISDWNSNCDFINQDRLNRPILIKGNSVMVEKIGRGRKETKTIESLTERNEKMDLDSD